LAVDVEQQVGLEARARPHGRPNRLGDLDQPFVGLADDRPTALGFAGDVVEGEHSAADPVATLQHGDLEAPFLQQHGGTEAREACTHNDNAS
jgi:hypothetical protein